MLDETEFQRWRRAADEASAGAAAQRSAGLHNWACFLSEQAAQLAVKGLLHAVGEDAWGHDLVELGDRFAAVLAEALSEDLNAALRRLSRHYIPARYPDAHPAGSPAEHYGEADSGQADQDLDRVLVAVDAALARLRAEDH